MRRGAKRGKARGWDTNTLDRIPNLLQMANGHHDREMRFLGYIARMQSDERFSVVSGEVKVAHVELEVACTMGLIAQSCASLKSERAGRVPT